MGKKVLKYSNGISLILLGLSGDEDRRLACKEIRASPI
jgi:hypothetical protein